jgi:two-component system sensor histidine kinase ChiS
MRIACLLALLVAAVPALASEPALARLSFWVPDDRQEEFAEVFAAEVLPSLQSYGMRLHDEPGRATVPGVFSRLFAFDSATQIDSVRHRIGRERVFLEPMRRYGERFGTDSPSGIMRAAFRVYRAPVANLPTRPAVSPAVRVVGAGGDTWHTLDVTDGLAGPMVQAMLQDRHGQLWLGTRSNGLSRYDGAAFHNVDEDDGLPGNDIRSLFEDREGRLWVGTTRGAARIDSQGITALGEAQGFPAGYGKYDGGVLAIDQDRDGRLWFAVLGVGLLVFDGQTWDRIDHEDGLQDTRVTDVALDRDGALWISTLTGIERYLDGEWTNWDADDGLPASPVFCVDVDRNGAVWVGFNEGGAARFDGEAGWTRFGPELLPALDTVIDMHHDADGDYWFSTGGGAVRWDGESWERVSLESPLPHNAVHRVVRDDEGSLWFATMGGAVRFDPTLRVLRPEDGLRGPVHHLHVDRQGAVWMAHNGIHGVSRLRGDTLTTWPGGERGLPSVHRIVEDDEGRIWLLTHEGVIHLDEERDEWVVVDRRSGLPSGTVVSLAQTADGALWLGTGNGVARWNGHVVDVYGPEDGLAGDEILDLLVARDGRLWLTADSGVSWYDGESFHTRASDDGGPPPYVLDIEEAPDGALWFATHGGIARLDGTPDEGTFRRFTTDDGLASNDVHSVEVDDDGIVWAGTDGGGISRFDGDVFQNVSRRDGLPDNVTLTVAPAGDGSFWIGGTAGLSRLQPQPMADVPVFVDAVIADRRYDSPAAVAMPTTVEVVSFEVRGISLKTGPEQMVYCYRLLGHDDTWRHTRTPRIEFAGLPTGNYTFEVMAVDRDLGTSQTPARVSLRVHLPYERMALIGLSVLAIGLVGWQAARVVRRDARLRATNRQLEENARALEKAHQEVLRASQAKSAFLANMSHELRTPMNAIINFSSLIRDGAYGEITPDLRDAVEEIDRNGDNLLSLINDVLDLSKIEAGAMTLEMGECSPAACVETAVASQQHRALAKGLDLTPETNGDLPVIRADERRLTQQVLVNLVDNAIKFTEHGSIRVGAEAHNGDVHFWVADTGKGIGPEERERVFQPFFQVDDTITRSHGGTGLGLAIVRRFIELHGGRIWLDSEPGRGSTFHFEIPRNGRDS